MSESRELFAKIKVTPLTPEQAEERRNKGYIYTVHTQGKDNWMSLGIIPIDKVEYVEAERYYGDYVELAPDEPYPFGEFEESDATTVCDIAFAAITQSEKMWKYLTDTLDMEDEEIERILTLLRGVLHHE